MYMSYCRFEGTYQEMQVCLNDVEEHINEEAEYDVSDGEIDYFRRMVSRMAEFLQETELIDEDGDVDAEMLDSICEKMRQGYKNEEDW